MGMYTSIVDSDVEITDYEGLLEYIRKLKSNEIDYSDYHRHMLDYLEKLEIIDKAVDPKIKMLSFQGLDGWKIISYWYDSMVQLLKDLALFVEGNVYLSFETEDEAGRIEFTDGECIIHTGQMQWQESSPDELVILKEEPEWIKELKIAKKI